MRRPNSGRKDSNAPPVKAHMQEKNSDVLEILRRELNFLEFGFYRVPGPGRPLFVFEDSPTCLRCGPNCNDCVLLRFVPEECQSEPVPCRHIPLNESNETVDSFYRTGTQQELEEALRNWLTSTIARLEAEERPARNSNTFSRREFA